MQATPPSAKCVKAPKQPPVAPARLRELRGWRRFSRVGAGPGREPRPRASVPAMPIARPMSASCSAGASLVPSPVTATISPISRSSDTSVCLSVGLLRAITRSDGSALSCCDLLISRNTCPGHTKRRRSVGTRAFEPPAAARLQRPSRKDSGAYNRPLSPRRNGGGRTLGSGKRGGRARAGPSMAVCCCFKSNMLHSVAIAWHGSGTAGFDRIVPHSIGSYRARSGRIDRRAPPLQAAPLCECLGPHIGMGDEGLDRAIRRFTNEPFGASQLRAPS